MAFWHRLFGYKIPERKDEKEPSFVAHVEEDGSTVIEGANAYGTYVDIDGTIKNEFELITRYREMALQPECDSAIDDIVNETIIGDKAKPPISLNLDKLEDISDEIKEKIKTEFDIVLKLLNFNNLGYDIFRKWYIDGRVFYHAVVDEENPKEGIKELRYIDPRQIRKIKEIRREVEPNTGVELIKEVGEYYVYNERGMIGNISSSAGSSEVGIKIQSDVIIYAHSGIIDTYSRMVLSNLNKAFKAWNQLRFIEDAVVIYRLTRAPERRVFYIDVGTMPKSKAEQYMRDIMNKYKNKTTYDASTGEIRNDKRYMTMNEDFWLPTSEGRSGTKIETLAGGQTLGEIQDIEYFQKKLYKALNVPITRMQQDGVFSFGKGSSITRDELKFAKFIGRLRIRFSVLFDEILERQLLLKKVVTEDEWNKIKEQIYYDYISDSFYEELKESEILRERVDLATQLLPMVPKFYSNMYIQKNILKLSDDDIEVMKQENQEDVSLQSGSSTGDPENQKFIDNTHNFEQEPDPKKWEHPVVPGEKFEHEPEKYVQEQELDDYFQEQEDDEESGKNYV